MTYNQMRDYFLVLKDKYGSPYYTDDEIALLLNRAQLDVVMELLPPSSQQLNVELSQNTLDILKPLLFYNNALNMNVSGVVPYSALDASVGQPVLRILSVLYNNKPVKWTRHNNWGSFHDNIFKVSSTARPRYFDDGNNFRFNPTDISAALIFTGIRYPETMLVDGSVPCSLPDFVHNNVVSRALEMAGVGSRDQMLAELQKVNNV